MTQRQRNSKKMNEEKLVEAEFGLQDDEKGNLGAVPTQGLLKSDERELKSGRRCGIRSGQDSRRFGGYGGALSGKTRPRVRSAYSPNRFDQTSRVPSKLLSHSSVSNSNDNFYRPTSPLSSSDEIEFGIEHRIPPKEEARLEKSARIGAITDGKSSNKRFYQGRRDDSELSDESFDSYVPKLLKIPPKRTPRNPSYSSDSSTYTDPIYQSHDKRRERNAWNHKSIMNVAPYTDALYAKSNKLPHSRVATQHSQRIDKQTNIIGSLLPKAGRSILKKSSLPKPPNDGASESPLDNNVQRVKHQTFSDRNCRATCWSGVLVSPAVTERLLRASQGSPEDLDGSGKKVSAVSRATPEPISWPDISESASIKTSKSAMTGVSSSVPSKNPPPRSSQTRLVPASSRDVTPVTPTLECESSKTGGHTGGVFNGRPLASVEPLQKTELLSKYRLGDIKDPQGVSLTSVGAQLKNVKVIGPTKKNCFNLDIGQGIDCINYLKANAPGANELQKRDLVELLVTPIEGKKVTKTSKPTEMDSSAVLVGRQKSVGGFSSSSSVLKPVLPVKYVPKVRDETVNERTPLVKSNFKTLDQIYKEVHGINSNNTPKIFVENDYEYEAKKKQRLTKHKI